MTRHARAVFLLGGWLLMYPRFGEDGKPLAPPGPPMTTRSGNEYRVLTSIPPVSQSAWVQVSAYDTAKECEKARVAFVGLKDVTDDQGAQPAPHLVRAARCVPAEHIYPPAGSETK
jgi:hypothetical protein